MKIRKSFPTLSAILILAGFTVTLGAFTSAHAQRNPNPGVVPRQSSAFGKTYEEWAVSYVQWVVGIPAARNPSLDETGEFCGEEQAGPVWYLAGTLGPGTFVRECHVPAGKALYVPLISLFGWAPEDAEGARFIVETFLGIDPTGLSDEEVIRLVVNWVIDGVTHLSVTVDGVDYRDLFSYRAETAAFTLDDTALFDDIGNPISHPNLVVLDGFALILAPLPVGVHTIHTRAEADDPVFGPAAFDGTYYLTVGP